MTSTMPINIEESPTQVIKALLALRQDVIAELLVELNQVKDEVRQLSAELARRGCV